MTHLGLIDNLHGTQIDLYQCSDVFEAYIEFRCRRGIHCQPRI
jgi:hypothetical protein